MSAIDITGLRKSYGSVVAVDDVSLHVENAEIFGVIGPNGAGKTTLLECVEGLRRPDAGQIRVMGLDPIRDGYELRERVGIQLQSSALPDRLKVSEALGLFASFYRKAVPAGALIRDVGLSESARVAFANLSGGQKQRLFIALALLNDPEIVFLDELTTGLDPQAKRAVWQLVRAMRERGKTVVLTTHSMEEASELCDRVAIIDRGKVIALDKPSELTKRLGGEQRVSFATDGLDPNMLRTLPIVARVETNDGRIVVYGKGRDFVHDLISTLHDKDIRVSDLEVAQPTLEDVFLSLTGREMRE